MKKTLTCIAAALLSLVPVSCTTGVPGVMAVSNGGRIAMVIGAVRDEGGVASCRVSEALKLTHVLPNAGSARVIRPGQFIEVDLKRLGRDGYDPRLEPGDVLQVFEGTEPEPGK